MKKLFIGLVMLYSVVAHTAQLDVSTLTKDQQAELTTRIEKMKSPAGQAASVSETVRKEAEAWGDLGGNVGKALVGAAKEVGVAADQFASTNLGKVVTAIVVYKLIGVAMIKLVVGLGILLVGVFVATYLIFTRFGSATYEYRPYLFGLWNRKVMIECKEDESYLFGRMLALFVTIVVTLTIGLATIF